MRPAFKRISHIAEYCALRAMQFLLSIIPRSLALKGGASPRIRLHYAGVYRDVVRKNMEFVNHWTMDEQKRIARNLYRTMGRYAVDFLRGFPPLPPHFVAHEEILGDALAKGKGVIILLGHFGNWELLADIFGSRVDSLSVVAKPMRNPHVDRWLARKRDAASVNTIPVDHALRKMYEAIKKNGIVAVLIDQHAGTQGTLVPFLGRETSTIRTVAGLEHKTGCAVLPTYALLRDDDAYEIVLSSAPEPAGDGTKATRRSSRRFRPSTMRFFPSGSCVTRSTGSGGSTSGLRRGLSMIEVEVGVRGGIGFSGT